MDLANRPGGERLAGVCLAPRIAVMWTVGTMFNLPGVHAMVPAAQQFGVVGIEQLSVDVCQLGLADERKDVLLDVSTIRPSRRLLDVHLRQVLVQ